MGLIIDYRPTSSSPVDCSWLFFVISQWIGCKFKARFLLFVPKIPLDDQLEAVPTVSLLNGVSDHIDPSVIYVYVRSHFVIGSIRITF